MFDHRKRAHPDGSKATVAGIGGMSEYSIMTGPEHWRIAYPAFIVVMVMLGITSYFLLRRLDGRGSAPGGKSS